MDILVHDVAVIDCTGREPSGRQDVVIKDGRIARIRPVGGARPRTGRVVDGSGMTLLPGLIDAHAHLALVNPIGGTRDHAWISHVLRVKGVIEHVLTEGFTTVRDAGGTDPAWARAVAAGELAGPRILPSGSPLSQTGGHGDVRAVYEAVAKADISIVGLIARPELVDGVDAVRRVVRDQLRRGATQIKVYASGGVMSPTDPLESVQLSVDELTAAVDAARDWDTYVLAHCHTAASVNRALDAGVRSIEHGSILDEATVKRMADVGAFLVPTLLALDELTREPIRSRLSATQFEKLEAVRRWAAPSIEMADRAGVRIGSGSDIFGPRQTGRARELVLKAEVLGAHRALMSATRVNSELIGMSERIGTIEVGKDADLILVPGEPLDDIGVVAREHGVPVVIQGGNVVKDLEGRAA